MKDIIKLDADRTYDAKNDIVMFGRYPTHPFNREWVRGNIVSIPEKSCFYLSVISSLTADVIPYKLEYLGFKNFEIKMQCVKNNEYFGNLLSKSRILYFYDDAEYAHFCLLFSEFIEPNKEKLEILP